ncbi:MAG: hypothetical protein EBV88_09145, partial [Actinobacteria bacterium]|nr:hypothetical protein [Actinomycetota bacterium]
MTLDPIAPSRRRRRVLLSSTASVIAVPMLAIMLLLGVPVVVAVLASAVLGLVTTALIGRGAQGAVLTVTGARPLGEDESPRLAGLVEGLCLSSGVETPSLHVIDSPTPNALIARQGEERPSLVVTTGLLDGLGRVEMEGAVAHLLARLKRREVRVATAATLLAAGPVHARDRDGRLASLLAALLAPLAGSAERLRRVVCPEAAVMHADVDGVALTRYPPGLISALERIAETPTAPLRGARSTAQ